MSGYGEWVHGLLCHQHGVEACDCDPSLKFDEWVLADKAGRVIGSVQRLQTGGPFYGVTVHGRTGPMTNRLNCQARVVQMLEGGA